MHLQPLDRVALTVSLILTIGIVILLSQGDQTAPRVREFTWRDQEVSALDRMFIMTFSRPMNQGSVEENLRIDPPLNGKFAWAGRRMAFTLTEPIPYGQKFNLSLTNATDRFTDSQAYLTFNSEFHSPDRGFVYIGTKGEETGRLVLHNFTQNYHKILTPPNQVVRDFEIYPDHQHILYTATGQGEDVSLLDQELFRITTGIGNTAGQVELILDSKEYQIFKFDLSKDGEIIVVQRLSRSERGSYGLWQIRNNRLTPLNQPPGGEFIIAPDNISLAITQGQGLAILALEAETEPLDFLPKFGNILNFNQDGSRAAVVKFNTDFTRSLFVVNNQGDEEELLTVKGSLLSGEFDFSGKFLYVLLTEAQQTATTFLENPYLVRVSIPDRESTRLVDLKQRENVSMNLAPDNRSILLSTVDSQIYQFVLDSPDPLVPSDWWGRKPRWLP